MFDLTEICVGIISLICLIAARYFIPWIKEKLGLEKLTKAQKWVTIAVKAAEQLAIAGKIEKEKKKEHVIKFLEKKGFKLDLDLIEELIEAAVLELPYLLGEYEEIE